MNSIERKRFIIAEIQKTGYAFISQLSETLNVSSMTVRRDLREFANQGLVTLTHGGAMLNKGALFENNIHIKQEEMKLEKERIGKYCANLISSGDSVFIDSGTTAREVAENLFDKKNIVVITQSLLVANTLASHKNIKLLMAPGFFREISMAFLGQLTCEFISRFKIDYLFLGVEGIDIAHGATVPDLLDAETKRFLVNQAHHVVATVDHTKLGKSFFITVAKLNELDLIVTDYDADPQIVEEICAAGVQVELV